MKFIGFYDYTVVLTYISLISGVLGMRFASLGKIGLAIGCLMLSGFCDLFDGVVARTKKNRSRDEKNFGIQIDSLCDAVCFGVFPAVILYFSGVNTVFGIAILVFYVLCAIIRLAFFNVLEAKRHETEGGCTKSYRGMPVTTAAIIATLGFLVSRQMRTDSSTAVNIKPIKEASAESGISELSRGSASRNAKTPRLMTAEIIWLSVREEMNIQIDMSARPSRNSAKIAP